MVEVFACPECGRELEVGGLTPGGLIQCGDCTTWVEIPYIPRAAPAKRWRGPRARRPWERTAIRFGLVLMGFALVVAVVAQVVGSRFRADRERVLDTLVAAADAADAAGQPGQALIEVEAAVAHARTTRSPRLAVLLERRTATALKEAQARLAALPTLDPDRAVGEALTLRDRAKADPALSSLAEPIGDAVDAQRLRQASADLEATRTALAQGRDADVVRLATRLHDRAGSLAAADVLRFRSEAETLINAAVGRSGVAIPPTTGRFLRGSTDTYTPRVEDLWAAALVPKGYLPQPRRSPWRGVWDARAPFRAVLEITETSGGSYLGTPNQTTTLDGSLRFEHQGRPVWQNRVVTTPNDFPDRLSVSATGRAGGENQRDPALEVRIHESTVGRFLPRLAQKMGGIPARADLDRVGSSPNP